MKHSGQEMFTLIMVFYAFHFGLRARASLGWTDRL